MFKIDEKLVTESNLWSFDRETQTIKFPYADELLSEYQALFKSVFPNLNIDPSTPQGQLITSITQTDLNTIAFLQNMINAFFFGGTGFSLDIWAWNLFRITRKDGVKSQAVIKIDGVPRTQIPTGFQVTDGQHIFTIQSAQRLDANGTINALFIADELDDFQAPANSLNQMVNVILGIERVTNPNQASAPIQKETDTELFERCVDFGSIATNASFKSILANVANVSGVTKINGIENYTSADLTTQGLTLPAHSFSLIVKGGNDDNIAHAIYNSRATGAGMNGDVEIKIELGAEIYTYKFSRPTLKNLACEVKITNKNLIDANYKEFVKNAVVNYINALDIGALITQPNLANSVKNQISGFEIVDIKIGAKGEALSYDLIQLKGNEEAFIANDDISVELLNG